jgi:hypothetical protein
MSVVTHGPVFRPVHLPRIKGRTWTKLLLACGAAFPILWVGMDIVASLRYEGYNYVDQTVSELSAIGAPTRTLWLAGGAVYGALEIVFAAGLWLVAGRRRALRAVAGLFALHAAVNLALGPFSSMHQRQVLATDGATLSDTLHLVLVAVGAIIFFAEIGLAATAFGDRFRLYSIVTILAMVVFGFVTSLSAADLQANEPTPEVGIYERVNAYGYMLWVVVLAATLWRLPPTGDAPTD